VAGGKSIGSIEGLDGSEGFETRIGCTGVLNAGEEEGIGLDFVGACAAWNKDAVRVPGILSEVSIAHIK